MRQERTHLPSSAPSEVTMNRLFLVFAMTAFTLGCRSSGGDDGIMTDDPPLLTKVIDELGVGD